MTERFLTCIGDANDIGTRGGSPFDLLRAGLRSGFLTGGWSIDPSITKPRRLVWNLLELLRSAEWGGYQYTLDFAWRMLAQVPAGQKRGEIISTFPVFPQREWVEALVSFYIDATFTQLFGEYGKGALVSSRVQREALAREREQYEGANRICCMARWAASSVVLDYGIPAERVHVVGGGANLLGESLGGGEPATDPAETGFLRLGFVGKDWQRKRLQMLLTVAEYLAKMGWRVEVAAAGFEAKAGPGHELLRPVGFLDKRHDPGALVAFMRCCHFGCLFSDIEAYGLSNREFLRVGVPVLTRNVGGLDDTVPAGYGKVFAADSSAESIAGWLDALLREPGAYQNLRRTVAADPEQFTWDRVVERMQSVWAGSTKYSYEKLAEAATVDVDR